MLYPDLNELLQLRNKASGLSLAANRRVASSVSGDYSSPFRGQGLEFAEVREYVAGDDVRNIDWRVTARTGTPNLKIFNEERERTVIICVDANEHMRFGTRGTFKSIQAARAAALLGWRANSINNRVGTCLFGNVKDGTQFFQPKRSRASLWQMLKALSDKNPYTSKAIEPEEMLLHLNKASPTGALIFIISDFLHISESLEKQLGNLRKRCDIVLVKISDPADEKIAPIGTILFSSDNDNKNYINTDSKAGREKYEQMAQENKDKLKSMAVRLRLSVIHLATERDVYGDLLYGLKYIAKMGGRK